MQAAFPAEKNERHRRSAGVIDRAELIVAEISDETSLVVIEAPTGFGKTILASQFAATFGHQIWIDEPQDLDAADLAAVVGEPPSSGGGWCVVIDNVERVDGATTETLSSLIEVAQDKGATVVVAGRVVPDAIWIRAELRLGIDDLLLSAKQIEPHLSPSLSAQQRAEAADVIREVSQGWIAAVAEPIERIQLAAETPQKTSRDVDKAIAAVVRHGTAQSHYLEPTLRQLRSDDVALVRALAVMDRFDDEILSLLHADDDFADRTARAGLLTTRMGIGLPDVFRAVLAESSSEASEVDTGLLASHLVERGEITQAIDLCMAFGDHELAAETIAALEHRHSFLVDVDDFNRCVTLLPAAAAKHPRVFLVQCWVNVVGARVADSLRALERGREAVQQLDPDETKGVRAEILAELAFYTSIDADHQACQPYLDELAALGVEGSDTAAEARMLEARANLAGRGSTTDSLEHATRDLSAATAIWRRLGDSARLVSGLMRLAINLLEPMGRYLQALNVLDEALAQRPLAAFDQARIEMFRSRLLPMLGEGDAASEAAAQADRLATRLDMLWISGMTSWAAMRAASYDADENRMIASFSNAQSRLGELLRNDSGAIFHCEAADAFARFGRLDEAEGLVAAARPIAGDASFVVVAEIAVQARAGDAARALELIETGPTVAPGLSWYLHALGAIALQRLGRTEDAVARLADAQGELDRLGQHDVLQMTEARLVSELARPRASTLASFPAPTPELEPRTDGSAAPTRVTVFGPFQVACDGKPLARPPRGRSAVLVKFLAVNGGRVVVDQAIEALWPGCDSPTGRQRLRNVLRRCRKSIGPVIDRDGESLVFNESVTSDFDEVLELFDEACVRNPDSLEAVDAAVAALSAQLLPDDRYEDWAELARADLDRRRERVRDHQQRLAAQLGVSRPA